MSRRKRRDNVGIDVYGRFRGGRGLQRHNDGENDEEVLYRLYERILGELAMNRFEWKGLPDYIDKRFIELTMHVHGCVVVFKDTGTVDRPGTDRIFALQGSPAGKMTMTDNPTSFILTGPGVEEVVPGRQLSAKVVVPIWPNFLRTTDWDIITTYARKLANVDRTIEINLKSARRTKVLVYDENQRLSAENLNRQIDNGDPSVAVKFDIGGMVQALDLGVDPKSIETISVVRGRLWSEAMGLLGINNSNQDKKERLVESEVSANDDQVATMRRVTLNGRQFACEQMRKKFPEELGQVSVDYWTGIGDEADMYAQSLGIEPPVVEERESQSV